MAMDEQTVGIAGIGSYLPEKTIDAWEAVRDSGISRKKFDRIGCKRLHQAGPGEMPSDMSIKASRLALDDAGLDPAEIDLIIYTGSVKDHTRWQAAAKIQYELGCKNAYGFDIYQGCNGQNMAMNIGSSMIRSDPNIKAVLITSGERFDSTLDPPILGRTYLFGDGGSAGILKRDHSEFNIISTAYKTWGIHHGNFCVPEVGAYSKLSMEVVERGGHQLQIWRPLCTTREELQEFGERLIEIADELIDKACARAGVTREEIDFVATVNGSKRHNSVFLERMRLSGCKSNIDYIEECAHMGSTDTFYNLDRARREGAIAKGDLILFYTGGAGYTWAITMVRY
jgi:3-oxoacyl-[acyl-carrier-protein] synthase III